MGRQPVIVLDTHVLVWAIADDKRLGKATRNLIKQTAQTDRVAVSAITPWEIALLVEKGRLRLGHDVRFWIDVALALPGIHLVPIEPMIVVDSVSLPGEFHADPADRFLVSTARILNVPLVTADGTILSYAAAGHVLALDATK